VNIFIESSEMMNEASLVQINIIN